MSFLTLAMETFHTLIWGKKALGPYLKIFETDQTKHLCVTLKWISQISASFEPAGHSTTVAIGVWRDTKGVWPTFGRARCGVWQNSQKPVASREKP